jgi:MFS family permease
MLTNRLGAMVVPFLAIFLTDVHGISVGTAGEILAGFGAGSLVSYLTGGALADRIGRRATLIVGMLTSAAVLVALGYVHSFALTVVSVFALGLTVDLYRPAAAAMVADIVPSALRPWAYSQLYWAVNLGFSIATVSGGLLARQGFGWLVWLDAITSVSFALLVWRAMPESGGRVGATTVGQASVPAPSERSSYLSVFRDPIMLAFTAISLLYACVFIQGTTTLPLVMRLHGLSSAAYGVAIAFNGLTILLAQPVLGRWVGRLDHSVVAAAGMALLGAGFGVAALAEQTWQYAASVAIWTLGEATVMSVAQTIVARLAPVHMRGRYNGVFGATWSGAFLVGPPVGTWLIQSFGGDALWLACLGAGLIGAAAQLALAPAVRSRGVETAGSSADPRPAP